DLLTGFDLRVCLDPRRLGRNPFRVEDYLSSHSNSCRQWKLGIADAYLETLDQLTAIKDVEAISGRVDHDSRVRWNRRGRWLRWARSCRARRRGARPILIHKRRKFLCLVGAYHLLDSFACLFARAIRRSDS